jgi:hypothetical protein
MRPAQGFDRDRDEQQAGQRTGKLTVAARSGDSVQGLDVIEHAPKPVLRSLKVLASLKVYPEAL